MKKLLSLLLVFTILIGCATIVKADTAGSITLSKNVDYVKVGDNVIVTLKTSKTIQSADFKIIYDSEKLEFQSSSLELYNEATKGTVAFSWYDVHGTDTFTFTFKAIKEGNADVSTEIEELYLNTTEELKVTDKSLTIGVEEDLPISVSEVKINKSTLTIKKGESATLTGTVLPEGAQYSPTWEIADTSIATGTINGIDISETAGLEVVVTGKKVGTTTITFNAGKSTTCTINVIEDEPAPTPINVNSLELEKKTLSIEVGEEGSTKILIDPSDVEVNITGYDNTIISCKEDIAAGSRYIVVTAKKAGKTTITVKAGDKTTTCEVTVVESDEPTPSKIDVTSITLNKTKLSLIKGKTETLTATILPTDATNKTITWTSSDKTVATIENGKITALKKGTTIITAKAGEKTATCEVTVTEESSSSKNNNDGTTAKTPIPQAGETITVVVSIIGIIGLATYALIRYRRYKDI